MSYQNTINRLGIYFLPEVDYFESYTPSDF